MAGEAAGLRRGEIDLLEWSAFDFEKHEIRIASTEFLNLKTEESRASVEIDPEVAAIFSKLAEKPSGRFVIESTGQIIRNSNWSHYRCDKVFDGLLAWPRDKGVRAQKPLHELRKEQVIWRLQNLQNSSIVCRFACPIAGCWVACAIGASGAHARVGGKAVRFPASHG